MQHPLFIAHDNVRCTQVQEPFQPVVPVDDPTVQVVQVTGGKAAAIQLHHGAQVWRNDRQNVQHHPGRIIAGSAHAFHHFQATGGLHLTLAAGILNFFLELFGNGVQVNFFQQGFNRFGTDAGHEIHAVFRPGLTVFRFRKDLILLQAGDGLITGINDNIADKINNTFQLAGAHVQNQTHPAGNAFKIPNMGAGGGQFNMTHALTAHGRLGDFHPAAVTDNAFISDALILPAVTLPVFLGAKNTLTKETVPFRF